MNAHTIIADIRQDVSKIREDTGSQNKVVSDMCMYRHFSIHTDRRLDSEQVSNFGC